MEAPSPSPEDQLTSIHDACVREKKTAVVPLGNEELHLVAMPSKRNSMQYSCFWGFTVASGLYNSCLVMLNLRCLGIVFDLDETLVVANTMRSFEDRINNLQQKMSNENDQQRLASMLAEIKRYQDDRTILKQFIENDQVVENGKLFKVQAEIVRPLSESHQQINRPVIRLQEKNIILTRVNPAIRDTSVLVRVRPAWEELRSYLTARGRKRFEVYVCTMAERDYALEIWRLLDPESNLINSNEILDRIVCVKSELKKSLLSVFQDGKCHPRMSLVIDDRLAVWDFKDKPRVHVVPAFAPYHAPQAEVVSSVSVLCVARNVACNVRGGFFKEYDDTLLPRIAAACYEDEVRDLPSAPDVSNYLISEEETSLGNGNNDLLSFDGMADAEVERRLKEANCNSQAAPFIVQGANCNGQTVPPMVSNFNHMQMTPVHHVIPSSFGAKPLAASQRILPYSNNPFPQPTVLMNPPAIEEGEVNDSELDPDTRRRLLILQHGQDVRGPSPLELRPQPEVPVTSIKSPESWLPKEEEMKPRQKSKASNDYPLQPETIHFNKRLSDEDSYTNRIYHRNKRLTTEVRNGSDGLHRNYSRSNSLTGEDMSRRSIPTRSRDEHFESGLTQFSKNPVEVLQGIAAESGTKVEYRITLLNSIELQFSVEAWFLGEKMGEGIGRSRKESQKQAAQEAIQHLADHYLDDFSNPAAFCERKQSRVEKIDIFSDSNLHGPPTYSRMETLRNPSEENLLKPSDAAVTLKELCTLKGFSLAFKTDSSLQASSDDKQGVCAQVEIAGQILGKGSGTTWNIAKLKASEEALANLESMLGQFTQNCLGSSRIVQSPPKKSWKKDCSQILRGSSDNYSKNIIPQS
ncbi:uncharacterized protein A4U43_C07F21260 [Asparagus officinalis]|uniref:protein-serine/threonine phosphatase n=2 Tax=Asparagus officinalis TaxID=4686 RepID=A0A5P1EDR0_ASPOF|nr:uncharacterized protein A4U43_C07F21260 [Asparagus officinalis]